MVQVDPAPACHDATGTGLTHYHQNTWSKRGRWLCRLIIRWDGSGRSRSSPTLSTILCINSFRSASHRSSRGRNNSSRGGSGSCVICHFFVLYLARKAFRRRSIWWSSCDSFPLQAQHLVRCICRCAFANFLVRLEGFACCPGHCEWCWFVVRVFHEIHFLWEVQYMVKFIFLGRRSIPWLDSVDCCCALKNFSRGVRINQITLRGNCNTWWGWRVLTNHKVRETIEYLFW